MTTDQPYLEVEGTLYWIASDSDGMGNTVHTYLMDHVPGEFKVKSSVPLDTDTKKRIVKIENIEITRPIITKELLGTTYKEGAVKADGVIVDTIPANGVNLKEYIDNFMKPAEVDRTYGHGTVWEQLAALDTDDED